VAHICADVIIEGLKAGTHYTLAAASEASSVISSLNATTCYSTFAEPHYIYTSTNAPVYFSAVQSYVQSGGNFYAQCACTSPPPTFITIRNC
jgi:hypothetical protein